MATKNETTKASPIEAIVNKLAKALEKSVKFVTEDAFRVYTEKQKKYIDDKLNWFEA